MLPPWIITESAGETCCGRAEGMWGRPGVKGGGAGVLVSRAVADKPVPYGMMSFLFVPMHTPEKSSDLLTGKKLSKTTRLVRE